MRAHPVLVGGGVAVVVALLRGRVRLLPLFGRAIAGWRLWQMVGGLLAARQAQRETVSR
jgi:hypothetical protein